jgi:hypothetical protein
VIAQYEQALRIKEKAFGVDHINTADTTMNVGLLYKTLGQVTLASNAYCESTISSKPIWASFTHTRSGDCLFLTITGKKVEE